MKTLIGIIASAAFLISLLTFCAIATLRIPITGGLDGACNDASSRTTALPLHSRPCDTSLIYHSWIPAW